MDVHSRSAFHPLLGRLRIGAPRLWPLSPELHTSDRSFACPGSSTWVDKVPSQGRVRRSHCCDFLPSEPCVRVAPHTAQASAAGEKIPSRTEHPILFLPDGRLSTPVLVQLALSNVSVG